MRNFIKKYSFIKYSVKIFLWEQNFSKIVSNLLEPKLKSAVN